MFYDDLKGFKSRLFPLANKSLQPGILKTTALPTICPDPSIQDRAHGDLPRELAMLIASCMESDADRRTLRLLNEHWKAAVDESVTRLSANMYKTQDGDIVRLAAFRQLQSLSLSQCAGVTDLRGLARLPRLQSLDLSCCTGLKPPALRVLAHLSQLRKLDLSGCSAVTDECIAHIAGLPELEWLSLQGCTALSAAGLQALQKCRRLRHLDLSGTAVVGLRFLELRSASPDTSSFKTAGHHSGATVFTIQADCSSRKYTEAGAVRHIREAPRFSLKRLLLRDCPALAESALCSLAGHAELETLDLSRSPQALLDASACALEKLKGLRRLHLEDSPDLGDDMLLRLTALQGLSHLDVSECPNLAPSALATLRGRMPSTCAIFSATS